MFRKITNLKGALLPVERGFDHGLYRLQRLVDVARVRVRRGATRHKRIALKQRYVAEVEVRQQRQVTSGVGEQVLAQSHDALAGTLHPTTPLKRRGAPEG